MCTYSLVLDDQLVAQAEQTLNGVPFQIWLQQQVENLMREQTAHSHVRVRHRGLSDEQLSERLKDYPMLTESDFPELSSESYSQMLRSNSGKLIKGLEKWL